MARPPPQTVGDKQLVPPLVGDERLEVIGSGGLRQVVTLQQIADFIGGGGAVVTTVPNGGTGLASLTLNGVLYGNGVAPVGVTAQGTEGQVLTAHGASAPGWQDPVIDPYPPLPVPNLGTWLQAHVDANTPADWIWGNYTIPAPITINWNATLSGWRFDGHGAMFSAGFTNTAVDLLTFIVPDSAPVNTNIIAPQIVNMALNCGAGTPKTKNGLTISCRLNTSYIFGLEIINVNVFGAARSGILYYGDVFESDIIGCMCRDNARAGLEFRNPTAGGTGIISSIKVIGGDYRTNKYGIMTSADTTYQEPGGIHVTDADFISNTSAGIFCFAGAASITGCHFENNCNNNAGETEGAIFNTFGPIKVDACDATASNSVPQNYLVDFLGQAGQPCYISRSYCQNTDTGAARQIAKLAGNGTLWMDPSIPISSLNNTTGGTGWPGAGWSVINSAAAMRTNTQTGATYTVVDNDTDIIANRAGTITLTLPSATNYLNRAIRVRTIQAQTVVSASSNVVPLIGGAAGTAILAATAGKWAELVSDGTNWQIMAGN